VILLQHSYHKEAEETFDLANCTTYWLEQDYTILAWRAAFEVMSAPDL
jgi:hypothetical protein